MFNYNKRSIVVEFMANMINYPKYWGVECIMRSKQFRFWFVCFFFMKLSDNYFVASVNKTINDAKKNGEK